VVSDTVPGAVGYFVKYDTVSQAPFFESYASSQYFSGGNPSTGLTVTGTTVGTKYAVVCASFDGTTAGAPSAEESYTAA
jgi:hypothetical protein